MVPNDVELNNVRVELIVVPNDVELNNVRMELIVVPNDGIKYVRMELKQTM